MENYQKKLDELISSLEGTPALFLHACCAPCSSYVLEYLSNYFRITIYYYNPNITPQSEYRKRTDEVRRLISELPVKNKVEFQEGEYDCEGFFEMARGLEHLPEGSERCFRCYEMRMRRTAELALEKGFDYFTTTLSISPHKNAQKLNEIGQKLEKELGIKYLCADFKKKNGYKRSIELSREYSLYRQDYCGCIFSKRQKNEKILEKDRDI